MPVPSTVPQVRRIPVTARQHGQRLDNFLLRVLEGVPKSHVYRLVRSGQVRVNGGRARPDRRLAEGDEVRVPPVRTADPAAPLRPPDAVLERLAAAIIHDDAHYLAINKPAGLAAHGGSGLPFGAIEALRVLRPEDGLELAHRLDRDTSGVLLLTKTRPALLRAQQAFRDGQADKRYLALLCGRWQGGARDVDAALVRNRLRGGERMVQSDADGKASRTRFLPRRRYAQAALCEVQIFSGRTHQIRVHAATIGHPVAGDRKYDADAQSAPLRALGLKRMFLHAWRLNLPASDGLPALKLQAPLPEELEALKRRLAPEPTAAP